MRKLNPLQQARRFAAMVLSRPDPYPDRVKTVILETGKNWVIVQADSIQDASRLWEGWTPSAGMKVITCIGYKKFKLHIEG